jgi:hypothetical protein
MKIKPLHSNGINIKLSNGLTLNLVDVDGSLIISSNVGIKSEHIRRSIEIKEV